MKTRVHWEVYATWIVLRDASLLGEVIMPPHVSNHMGFPARSVVAVRAGESKSLSAVRIPMKF